MNFHDFFEAESQRLIEELKKAKQNTPKNRQTVGDLVELHWKSKEASATLLKYEEQLGQVIELESELLESISTLEVKFLKQPIHMHFLVPIAAFGPMYGFCYLALNLLGIPYQFSVLPIIAMTGGLYWLFGTSLWGTYVRAVGSEVYDRGVKKGVSSKTMAILLTAALAFSDLAISTGTQLWAILVVPGEVFSWVNMIVPILSCGVSLGVCFMMYALVLKYTPKVLAIARREMEKSFGNDERQVMLDKATLNDAQIRIKDLQQKIKEAKTSKQEAQEQWKHKMADFHDIINENDVDDSQKIVSRNNRRMLNLGGTTNDENPTT
jgi:hypothetical protein